MTISECGDVPIIGQHCQAHTIRIMRVEQIDGKLSIWERFKCTHTHSRMHTNIIYFHKSRQIRFRHILCAILFKRFDSFCVCMSTITGATYHFSHFYCNQILLNAIEYIALFFICQTSTTDFQLHSICSSKVCRLPTRPTPWTE